MKNLINNTKAFFMELFQNRILSLPVTALIFALSSVAVIILSVEFLNILIVLLPVLTLIFGVGSLCLGKEKIGKTGIVMAIISIALVLILVAVIFINNAMDAAYEAAMYENM